MIVGLDHVVLAVDDPDAAADELRERLGLEASAGGRHERLGTFNRLVWLGDSFLELVGVFDRGLAGESWFGRLTLEALGRGGGLATWVVALDDLDAHLRWLPADAGLTGPIDGARVRPDGGEVRWRMAHPPAVGPTVPFLIEHDPTGAEWTDADRAARAEATHPVGGKVRLATIDVATDRLAAAAGRLRTLLGTHAQPDGRRAVLVQVGGQAVRFVMGAAEGGPAATIELGTDAVVRTRKVRIGDAEIRLRGRPPVRVVDGDTEAPADAGAA